MIACSEIVDTCIKFSAHISFIDASISLNGFPATTLNKKLHRMQPPIVVKPSYYVL